MHKITNLTNILKNLGFWMSSAFILVSSLPLTSQNLVPNPGFEQCDQCDNRGSVEFGLGKRGSNIPPDWRAATHGSSDIRSLEPRSDRRHGGFFMGTKYEYLANELIAPLSTLSTYEVRWFVKAAEATNYLVDQLGFLWTYEEPEYDVFTSLSQFTPDFETPDGDFIQSGAYQEISYSYLACGGEAFFVMGRFPDLGAGDTLYTGVGRRGAVAAYVVVDDVSIIETTPFDFFETDSLLLCEDTLITSKVAIDTSLFDIFINGIASLPQVEINTVGLYTFEAICKESQVAYRDTMIVYQDSINIEIQGDTLVCPGDSVLLSASILDGYEYSWNTGDTTTAIWIQQPGTFTVVVNGDCKVGTASHEVGAISAPLNIDDLVPNVFSPNNDGQNDAFQLKKEEAEKIDIQSLEVTIFSRWGNEIFSSSDPNFAWDGEGSIGTVYLYSINMTYIECGNQQEQIQLSGDVTLVK